MLTARFKNWGMSWGMSWGLSADEIMEPPVAIAVMVAVVSRLEKITVAKNELARVLADPASTRLDYAEAQRKLRFAEWVPAVRKVV